MNNRVKKFVKTHRTTINAVLTTAIVTGTTMYIMMARDEIVVDVRDIEKYNVDVGEDKYRLATVTLNPKKYKF